MSRLLLPSLCVQAEQMMPASRSEVCGEAKPAPDPAQGGGVGVRCRRGGTSGAGEPGGEGGVGIIIGGDGEGEAWASTNGASSSAGASMPANPSGCKGNV